MNYLTCRVYSGFKDTIRIGTVIKYRPKLFDLVVLKLLIDILLIEVRPIRANTLLTR
jgi:hypothetical protein